MLIWCVNNAETVIKSSNLSPHNIRTESSNILEHLMGFLRCDFANLFVTNFLPIKTQFKWKIYIIIST